MSVNTAGLWTGILNSRRFYRLDRVVQFGLTAERVPSHSNQVTPISLVTMEAQVGIVTAPTFVDCIWNVMAHAQKPDFFFRRNGRIHLNRRGRQFSRLLAAEVCASAVVMLDTPCSEVVWRALATHSIRQFHLHFPAHASLCAITFQLDSTVRTEAALVTSQLHVVLRVNLLLFLSDLNRTWICSTDFSKPRNIECYENRSSGSRVVPCLRTDGQAGWS